MYHIEVGGLKYLYLVGPYTIGIVTPSRKRYIVYLDKVRDPRITDRPVNGMSDSRVTPEEVAGYVLTNRLK